MRCASLAAEVVGVTGAPDGKAVERGGAEGAVAGDIVASTGIAEGAACCMGNAAEVVGVVGVLSETAATGVTGAAGAGVGAADVAASAIEGAVVLRFFVVSAGGVT